MDTPDIARELFLGEFNCAQSVLISFANKFGYSKELAAKLAAGFGGGMGMTQATCGAVTGGIMVLGLMAGEKSNNYEELKSKAYGKVKEFIHRFETDYKTTECKGLIECDLNTKEGQDHFKEKQIKQNVCANCVAGAVKIIEDLV